MSFAPEVLVESLAAMPPPANAPPRYLIAFSGGLDSVVLSHALASLRDTQAAPLLALHIDHGLQPESSDWVGRCEAMTAAMGIQFLSQRVTIDADSDLGIEAAARDARYAALAVYMQPGDCLLSAHHQDDQAETLLLNVLRGAGPSGLAAMARCREFAGGYLLRPLLGVARADLLDYAVRNELDWIEDPSNADTRFDRNFLRRDVLPRLKQRWPGAVATLARSAQHARDASELLDELAATDMQRLGDRPERLPLAGLAELSAPRVRNLLRYALRTLGLPVPNARQMQTLISDVIAARTDATPLVSWPGAECRRYRQHLYLQTNLATPEPATAERRVSPDGLKLGEGLGRLSFEATGGAGLDPALLEAGLVLRFRDGGEKIKPYSQTHTKKLKKLLQEAGLVPWMRDRIPLLYAGDRLVAVADLWLADEAVADPGVTIRWLERPALR